MFKSDTADMATDTDMARSTLPPQFTRLSVVTLTTDKSNKAPSL